MATVKDLTRFLESIAPPSYQESYDNSGLIVGDPNMEITGVVTCLDSTEAVLDEALELGCNVVVAHHPIVFKGLKRFTGKSYVERVVMKAIKHDIAIYAIHTNLDNVYHQGVNARFAQQLGLNNTRILAPKANLKKMITFAPDTHIHVVRQALFAAGAGTIGNAQQISHASLGVGTNQESSGIAEVKLEIIFAAAQQGQIINALQQAHPATRVPYEISTIENTNQLIGSGMIGELETAISAADFLQQLKEKMQTGCIKHTALLDRPIKKVAICGGSGGFLLKNAIRAQADIFITADYKYHEFFDADGQIIIADIGHFESEQYTIDLLYDLISEKFSNFALHYTKVRTNPVFYLS
ncbi:MAG: Nif3-like dinuclear metal center hexameric protein [Saprospiraceae bacterium]